MSLVRLASCVFAVLLSMLCVAGSASAAISFQNLTNGQNNDANTLVIARPASVVAGDFLLAQVTIEKGSDITITAPAGWVLVLRTNRSSDIGQAMYYKVATGAEPASYTWNFNQANKAAGGILRYSGVDTANPIIASSGNSGDGSTLTGLSVASEANSMLVALYGLKKKDTTMSTPAGMTQRYLFQNPNDIRIKAADQLNPANPTGNRVSTAGSGDKWIAQLVTLRPATSVGIDHFAISHTGSGVACDTHDITITAHDSSHAPVDANALLVNLSTSNARGTWTGIAAGGGTLNDATAGDGAATYQFALGSNSVTLQFRYANLAATSETFSFNVSGGGFSETTGTAAGTEDPSFTLAQAGFRFNNVTDGNTTIPVQISGKPSNTGFNAKTIRIQAIRTDTATGSCVGLFASQTRSVDLGAECNNPAVCAARQVSINGGNIATSNDNGGAGASAYTGVNLAFNAASEADTVIAYLDAGEMSLHARYDLDPGVAGFEAIGGSSPFVVRPLGLAFPGVSHSSTAAGALIGAAGDNFAMTLQAYQWAAGEDANDDGVPDAGVNITDNGTVPNFAATGAVGVVSNLPGGALGTVSRGVGCANPANVAMAGGAGSAADWCYSEVGNAVFTASVTNYLAPGVSVSGNSGLDGDAAGGYVGRFKPKHFVVAGAPTLTNRAALACASTFTYMNEGLRLGFTLEARNAQDVLTQNYTGAYAKLNLASLASLGIGARSGATILTPRVDSALAPGGSFANGVASLTAVTGIRRASLDAPDGPYAAAQFGIAPNDNDPDAATGVQMQSFDLDADGGIPGNDHFAIAPATELRYGRLRLQNAYGSTSQALPIALEAQYWNGGGFIANALDDCTTLARANIALSFTGAIAACDTFVQQPSIAFASGSATLTLSAPGTGNSGTVLLAPQLGTAAGTYCPASPGGTAAATASPAVYLLGRWDDAANPDADASTSYDDNPSAQAGFGLYGSQPKNFIFFRENY